MYKEKIKTFRKFGVTVHLFDTNKKDSDGRNILTYELKQGRTVIFSGSDYGVSPMISTDSLDAVSDLLRFLTLKPGDTDSEYFDNYTEKQFEFINSNTCELLRLWIYDRELSKKRS